MRTKNIIKILSIVAVAAIFASCETTNQFASSFGKRKYMKGYYFNTAGSLNEYAAAQKSESKTGIVAVPTKNSSTVALPSSNNTDMHSALVPSTTFAGTKKANVSKNVVAVTYKNSVKSSIRADKMRTRVIAASPDAIRSEHHGSSSDANCKDWIVALVICIFLGTLGIHRFYLGYIGLGVLELLTFGCCGILSLVDLVRIAIKNLKPKDGDYCSDSLS